MCLAHTAMACDADSDETDSYDSDDGELATTGGGRNGIWQPNLKRSTVAEALRDHRFTKFPSRMDKLDTGDIEKSRATPLFRYANRKPSSSLDTSEIEGSRPKTLYPWKPRTPSSLTTQPQRPRTGLLPAYRCKSLRMSKQTNIIHGIKDLSLRTSDIQKTDRGFLRNSNPVDPTYDMSGWDASPWPGAKCITKSALERNRHEKRARPATACPSSRAPDCTQASNIEGAQSRSQETTERWMEVRGRGKPSSRYAAHFTSVHIPAAGLGRGLPHSPYGTHGDRFSIGDVGASRPREGGEKAVSLPSSGGGGEDDDDDDAKRIGVE